MLDIEPGKRDREKNTVMDRLVVVVFEVLATVPDALRLRFLRRHKQRENADNYLCPT
ncbi:hypothetical protein D3C86_2002860 [compost metagenome]